jgi:hypothetical protein
MTSITLLLPEPKRIAAAEPGAAATLASWRSRGDRGADGAAGRDAALREQFTFAGTTLPTAALTRQSDVGDAAAHVWLRADPAYVRADMATARMLACGALGLTKADCEALLQPLRPVFGDNGFPIDAPTPERWYLRCPAGAQLPNFPTPTDVLGDDLARHLPEGPAGLRWRTLMNDAQVLLHNHPLNAQRIAQGKVPVNSLWFWGGGKLPTWVKTPFTRVRSADPVVAALARSAGVFSSPDLAAVALGGTDATVQVLIDAVEGCGDAVARVDAALRGGDAGDVRLVFANGERVHYRRSHRWRFWRASVPLSA